MRLSAACPCSTGCRNRPRSASAFSSSTGMRCFSANASWRMPVTCHETFVRGAIAPASVAYFALLLAAGLYLNTWVVTRHRT